MSPRLLVFIQKHLVEILGFFVLILKIKEDYRVNKKIKNYQKSIIVGLLCVSALWSFLKGVDMEKTSPHLLKEWNIAVEQLPTSKVERVVDGDTIVIKINGQSVKVRLIGINAPESVHHDERKNTEEGKQASQYLKELLEGKTVAYEFDQEPQDVHGRFLAYIYLDKLFVNRHLVEAGYAKAKAYPPNLKHQNLINEGQTE